MKKKIVTLMIAAAITISLVACGEAEQTATEPAQEVVEEAAVEEEAVEQPEAEQPEESTGDEILAEDEDETMVFLRNLYGQYGAYLEEGFDTEGGVFVSPLTARVYLAPYFVLADANGDNYDDLIITGDLGLRDAKISEIMFYDDNDMAFSISSVQGDVYALSEACILVHNLDRDVTEPLDFDNTIVYKLVPTTDNESQPEMVIGHFNTYNVETGENTDEYYSGDSTITEEEYNDLFAKYDAAIIPLDNFVEMTAENIDNEVPKF